MLTPFQACIACRPSYVDAKCLQFTHSYLLLLLVLLPAERVRPATDTTVTPHLLAAISSMPVMLSHAASRQTSTLGRHAEQGVGGAHALDQPELVLRADQGVGQLQQVPPHVGPLTAAIQEPAHPRPCLNPCLGAVSIGELQPYGTKSSGQVAAIKQASVADAPDLHPAQLLKVCACILCLTLVDKI